MPTPKKKLLKALLKKASKFVGLDCNGSISVSFVGPRVITQINQDFLNHEGITDVISFNYNEEKDEVFDENDVEVEIIICVDFALNEGTEREDSSYEYELILYIVHGMLHAVGEDDLDLESRKIMRRREKEVMSELQKEFSFQDIFFLEKNGI